MATCWATAPVGGASAARPARAGATATKAAAHSTNTVLDVDEILNIARVGAGVGAGLIGIRRRVGVLVRGRALRRVLNLTGSAGARRPGGAGRLVLVGVLVGGRLVVGGRGRRVVQVLRSAGVHALLGRVRLGARRLIGVGA